MPRYQQGLGLSLKMLLSIGISTVLLAVACAGTVARQSSAVESEMKALYGRLIEGAAADPELKAGLMRAGFHDCATAHSGDPLSGCNGSLQNELNNPNNFRLVKTVEFVSAARDSVAQSVSMADAFMLGYAASTFVSGGGSIVLFLVDPDTPRTDVSGDDTIDSLGTLLLPNPFTFDFDELKQFYTERGMTARDMVVSLVVGHSLGGFDANPFDTDLFPVLPFVPQNDRIDHSYAGNLINRFETGADASDAEGFHTLPSDQAMIGTAEGVSLLNDYTNIDSINGAQGTTTNLESGFGGREQAITTDFLKFSVRMSKLSGDLVGNGLIELPNEKKLKPATSTKGWDQDFLDLVPRGNGPKIPMKPSKNEKAKEKWFNAKENDIKNFFRRKN